MKKQQPSLCTTEDMFAHVTYVAVSVSGLKQPVSDLLCGYCYRYRRRCHGHTVRPFTAVIALKSRSLQLTRTAVRDITLYNPSPNVCLLERQSLNKGKVVQLNKRRHCASLNPVAMKRLSVSCLG